MSWKGASIKMLKILRCTNGSIKVDDHYSTALETIHFGKLKLNYYNSKA